MLKKFLRCVPFLFIATACIQEANDNALPAKLNDKKPERHYLVFPNGDNIISGVLLPYIGKRIASNGIMDPEIIPLKGQPRIALEDNNRFPVGKPELREIPNDLSIITPGEDNFPLPDTFSSTGVEVPALQNPSIAALPPQKRDGISDKPY